MYPPIWHAKLEDANVERLRTLTDEERGRLFALACRAAARLERSRLANGLPPSRSVDWPESTWEFLRRSASNVKK